MRPTSRNKSVDAIRGFAMLMVVLGHTITGVTTHYEQSFIFQVIWTLQMPLFIIISGYVTKYSKPIDSKKKLWNFIKKRTLAYMFPWLIWTIVVRGMIFGQTTYLNVRYILWHMDSGYWFLATIWVINLIFGLTDYLCNSIKSKKGPCVDIITHLLGALTGMIILGCVGYYIGLDFFATKLTLYYTPFYFIGYLYGQLEPFTAINRHYNVIRTLIVAASFIIWISLINRIDFYSGSEYTGFIILRFFTSLIGCVAITGLSTANYNRGGVFMQGRSSLPRDLHGSLFMSEPDKKPDSSNAIRCTGIYNGNSELRADDFACSISYSRGTKEPDIEQAAILQKIKKSIKGFLCWCGINSLAIYLLHGFFLNPIKLGILYSYTSAKSQILIISNYTIAVVFCILIISVLNRNSLLDKLLFWK